MKRSMNAKLARLEALAASIPAPQPPGKVSLERLSLPLDVLQAMHDAVQRYKADHGSKPRIFVEHDLAPYLPPGVVEEMGKAIQKAKQEAGL